MPNPWFSFKQFTINHAQCAMKVSTDACLLGAWASTKQPKNILDIGAGSGVIGLMLAQRYAEAQITLVEIEKDCALQCAKNIADSPFADRAQCIHKPIQAFDTTLKYDLIVSNPPYFENDTPTIKTTRQMARHHTTMPLRDVFAAAKRLLRSTGTFCLILPAHRQDEALNIGQQMQLYPTTCLAVKSLPNKPVTRVLLGFSAQQQHMQQAHLTIYDTPGTYSAQATALLRPFYLHL